MSNVEIRRVRGRGLRDFLDVVATVYDGDPHYVRPLDRDVSDRVSPRANPFFEHGDAALFTAHRRGRCVGRISASIDRGHLRRYHDRTGFFGFFDTIDDRDVSRTLLARAESWLREQGMTESRGPISLNINEEVGCLVDGFDAPPYLLMPHHRPHQAALIEDGGYAKTKDVIAWRYTVDDLPPRVRRAHADIAALPEVASRPVSYANMDADVATIMDVFNDGWSDNWSFVPLTTSEMRKMAQDFRLILIPEITRITTIGGEPAAVAVAIPNLNELVRDLDGKLFPLGLPKLLWRLKVKKPTTARVIILGIRKKFQHVRKYAGLSAYLYAELNLSGRAIGMKAGEFGWTLEDNGLINAGIRVMGAKPYKTYRIFTKHIG